MKVNYRPKNRLKNLYFKRVLLLLAIFVFGASAFYFFEGTILTAVSPVWRVEKPAGRMLANVGSFFSSRNSLLKENLALKEKVYSLETEVSLLHSQQVQGNDMLALAGRKSTPETIIASVLTHPPQTPHDILVIDSGSNDLIVPGQRVLLPDGPILGTVSEVFPRSAKVKLFSTVGEETNAALERGNIPVVLIGAGGGNFRISLPRDVEVKIGDRILSSDISSYLLAIVEDVSAAPTDSLQSVLVRSPVNVFTLRFVFVTP